MATRKSTGKRLRFEVFKRDHFTCQYCGSQPPDVVLVADHVTPVAGGGETAIDNLITACEPCNQGKAAKGLESRQIRPDADLLYLSTQQETAELTRYHNALKLKQERLLGIVMSLQDGWNSIVGSEVDWQPADHILLQMMSRYSPEIVELAVYDVACKVAGGYLRKAGWLPYMWAVCRTAAKEREYDVA